MTRLFNKIEQESKFLTVRFSITDLCFTSLSLCSASRREGKVVL